jgi:hypothetical protein
MKFAADVEMQRISKLTQDFFEHVLFDEKPLL